MPLFLQDLCDFNIIVIGCNNVDSVRLVNYVSGGLHILSFVIGFIHPACKIIKWIHNDTTINLRKDLFFIATLLNLLYQLANAAKYLLMNGITADSNDSVIAANVTVVMVLEYLSLAFAGFCMTSLVSHFIEGALGYSFFIALAMFLKGFANDRLTQFIVPWQIIANLAILYSSTVLHFYSIYKSFPRVMNNLQKKISKESTTKHSALGQQRAAPEKTLPIPQTVVLQNTN
ncbi:hypothetical protein HDV06_002964 [Boothiomyces sp. JEL0866]|nr:hypothetical protein HDV06_002964 [Boothiomyces sp. JEL0866]